MLQVFFYREAPQVRTLALVLVCVINFLLGGCAYSRVDVVSNPNLVPTDNANWNPTDRQLLANPPYAQRQIPEQYMRQIVDYPRIEIPGTIVVDSDTRFLYFVLPQRQAIRYGVTVGEGALAWSGVTRIGRMKEWPAWVPTQEIKHRLGNVPDYVNPGPQNPMGARALYLYAGNKDTLYRIHGTNSRNILAMRSHQVASV